MRQDAQIREFMQSVGPGDIGVAVSGGGDSMALLVLLADWAKSCGRMIRVVTVDHGLRQDAAAEAQFVAKMCRDLALDHTVLQWDGANYRGNLQDEARKARLRLIGAWAQHHGLVAVATGHTQDDQAETFLMRLKRGSGVDGLSGMAPVVQRKGVAWIRPLLQMRRADLRDLLNQRGVSWVEDPSNQDVRFDRVVMRNALSYLDEIGLSVERLTQTAEAMARARQALEWATLSAARDCAEPMEIGTVQIDIAVWSAFPEEIRLRVLSHALNWVSGARYRPRLKALKACAQAVMDKRAHTLAGCYLAPFETNCCEISREISPVRPQDASLEQFDGRWTCCAGQGEWRVLGDAGLKLFPEWRETAQSRNALVASPALWYNNELKSAPFADKNESGTCWLTDGTESFFATIVTH